MKWIGQHIYDLAARFRGDVTIEGDLTVNGTYTQIDTDVTTTEQWLVTNDGTGPAAIINQKGSQDIFDVQDDGTSVFYIEDGGNVGIGTTSPGSKLEVAGNIKVGAGGKIWGNYLSNDYLFFGGGAGNETTLSAIANLNLVFHNGGPSGSVLKFKDGTNERMRIDTSGNVGIGTTSPSELLEVSGKGLFESVDIFKVDMSANPRLRIGRYNAETLNFDVDDSIARIYHLQDELSAAVHQLNITVDSESTAGAKINLGFRDIDGTNESTKFTVLDTGLVGIGTTSPSDKLDVQGGYLRVGYSGGAQMKILPHSSNNGYGFYDVNNANADMWFKDGNVGIGTGLGSTPSANLQLGSFGAANQEFRIESAGNSYFSILTTNGVQKIYAGGAGTQSNEMAFYTSSSGTESERVRIDNSGNVGIGTTAPTEKLYVVGDSYVTGDSHADSFKPDGIGEPIKFKNFASTELVRITDAGNVLIGTTTDSGFKLDVKGNLRIGDGGTGSSLNFNSTDRGTIKINGSEKMRLTSGGNLLIGTTTDSGEKLRVEGNVFIHNSNATLKIQEGTAETYSFVASGTSLDIKADSTTALSIFQNGDVLVGGASYNGSKLNVNGTATFSGQVTIPATPVATTDAASKSYVDAQVGASDTLQEVTDNGNTTTNSIRIGSSSAPASGVGLQVDSIMRVDASGGIATQKIRSSYFSPSSNLTLESGASANIIFGDNTAEKMRITSAGNVLIGTTTDSTTGGTAKMTIDVGSGTSKPISIVNGTTDGMYIRRYGSTGKYQLQTTVGSGNSGALSLQSYGGNVLIGTTTDSGAKLQVTDSASNDPIIEISNSDNGGVSPSLTINGTNTASSAIIDLNRTNVGRTSAIRYLTNGTLDWHSGVFYNGGASQSNYGIGTDRNLSDQKLIITSGGNVGIGTTSPASTLHVAGTVQVGVDNTGHDVIFYGATSGRSMLWDESYDGLILSDNTKLQLGSSTGYGDLQLLHDGTNSYVKNHFGDLYIMNNADDKDIIFQSDDGAGGVATYFSLDGGQATHSGSATTALYTIWPDKSTVALGSNKDLQLAHNGSESSIVNNTGNLVFYQKADDGDIIFQSDDGSGGLATYLTIDGGSVQTKFFKQTEHQDGVLGGYGNGMDLQLQHSGTDSYIDNYTGDLYVRSFADDKDIVFQLDDGAGGVATYFSLDGSSANHDGSSTTALYTNWPDNSRISLGSSHDFSMKHTGSDTHQENLTGDLYFTNYADDKDIIFRSDDGSGGVETYFFLDGSFGSSPYTIFPDSSTLALGTGGDLRLYHDSSHSYIKSNGTGNIYIMQQNNDADISFWGDDGSGGDAEYFRIDGGDEQVKVFKNLTLDDNIQAWFGSGNDLRIYHDGSNSYITQTGTGHLQIRQTQDDKDIKFECDDGSGGTTTYLTLDGSAGYTTVQKQIRFDDSVPAKFGTGNDLHIFHDGTDSLVDNYTGDLYFRQTADDKDIIFQSDDGSGGLATYLKIDGSSSEVQFFANLLVADNIKANFGNSGDLSIYHDGSNSFIKDTGTGDLYIDSSINFFVRNQANGEVWIKGTDEGVSLRYKDNQKIITTNTGIDVTGEVKADSLDIDGVAQIAGALTVGVDDTGHDVTFFGATSGRYLQWDESSDRLEFRDSVSAVFGNGADLHIQHDGTNSSISNNTGNLTFTQNTDDGDIIFQSDDGSGGVETYFFLDGSSGHTTFPDGKILSLGTGRDLRFYHDGSNGQIQEFTGDLKIVNNADDKDVILMSDDGSGGVTAYLTLDGGIGYTTAQKHILFEDNVKARFGSGSDLQVYHNGSNSYIEATGTGDLYIQQTTDDKDIIFQSDDGSGGVETYFSLDGSVGMTVFPDAKKLAFGSSFDLKIEHDGSNSYLSHEGTGNLIIRNTTDDADVIFQSDDGSGGVETYFYLDGSMSSGNPWTIFPDQSRLGFGDGLDLRFYHDGTNSYVENEGGNLYIRNDADDKDIIFQCDDGSGGAETYFKLDGSASGGYPYTIFPDNSRLAIGNSIDLQFFHDGTDSWVDNTTGDLHIRQSVNDKDIVLMSDDGSGGTTAYLTLDGSAGYTTVQKNMLFDDNTTLGIGASNDLQLYHNGSHSLISNQNGNLYLRNQTNDGDIIIQADNGSGGDATYMTFDGGIASILTYRDILMANDGNDGKIKFGASQDLSIYHDGSNSYIDQTGTGNLYIRNTQEDGLIYMQSNYNGSVSSFFYLHGAYSSNNPYTIFPDNSIAAFGNSADLRIYHDGSNSYIKEVGTGTLRLQTNGGGIDLYKDSTEFLARFITDGAAELYYDSVKKLETVTGGVNITGELEADSLDIDGDADISGNITTASWRGDRITTAYQYQRQTFEFKGYATHDGTNYEIANIMTDTNAPFEHDESIGADGTTAIAVSKLIRAAGQLMPYAGTIKKWLGFAAGSGSGTTNIALFRYRPDPSSTSDQSLVLIDDQALTMNGNNGVVQIDQSSFTDPDIAAGDIILTGIKGVSAKTTYFTSTLEIEWD